jgi:hypothetical protein
MDRPKVVLLVRFRTPLSEPEILKVVKERADEFRALGGLLQKFYVRDAATGEYGGLYLWQSEEALDEYRASALRASIGAAYRTEGEPRIEVMTVLETLRD